MASLARQTQRKRDEFLRHAAGPSLVPQVFGCALCALLAEIDQTISAESFDYFG